MHIEGLDELDNRIIEIIKDNARLTYSEIGGRLEYPEYLLKKEWKHLRKKESFRDIKQ